MNQHFAAVLAECLEGIESAVGPQSQIEYVPPPPPHRADQSRQPIPNRGLRVGSRIVRPVAAGAEEKRDRGIPGTVTIRLANRLVVLRMAIALRCQGSAQHLSPRLQFVHSTCETSALIGSRISPVEPYAEQRSVMGQQFLKLMQRVALTWHLLFALVLPIDLCFRYQQ